MSVSVLRTIDVLSTYLVREKAPGGGGQLPLSGARCFNFATDCECMPAGLQSLIFGPLRRWAPFSGDGPYMQGWAAITIGILLSFSRCCRMEFFSLPSGILEMPSTPSWV